MKHHHAVLCLNHDRVQGAYLAEPAALAARLAIQLVVLAVLLLLRLLQVEASRGV